MHAETNWGEMSTVFLVRGAQDGVRDARDELFERYSKRVLGVARARLGARMSTKMESADLAQDALVEALQSLPSYETRGESSLIRWLAAIVQNRISAKSKYFGAARRCARREISLDRRAPDESGPAIDPAADVPTPSGEFRAAERHDIVTECLNELPPNYRELIRLRDFEDLAWEEIAATIGAASPDAARMMHTRARTQLGKLLQARGV